MSYLEVLCEITELGYQVKMQSGTNHHCDGYVVYPTLTIEVRGLHRYCERCREIYGEDFKEDFDGRSHQHKHRLEYPVIFFREYSFDKFKNISHDLIDLRKTLVNLIQ